MIRIANGQGFWGDSLDAPVQQVRRGPIDYLTLDYLAEVTMSILQKQFSRDPQSGYARDFVQMIERGAKIRVIDVEGWYDAGKLDTLLETNQVMLQKGRAERPADVPAGVTIIEPVRIEAGATASRRSASYGRSRR